MRNISLWKCQSDPFSVIADLETLTTMDTSTKRGKSTISSMIVMLRNTLMTNSDLHSGLSLTGKISKYFYITIFFFFFLRKNMYYLDPTQEKHYLQHFASFSFQIICCCTLLLVECQTLTVETTFFYKPKKKSNLQWLPGAR